MVRLLHSEVLFLAFQECRVSAMGCWAQYNPERLRLHRLGRTHLQPPELPLPYLGLWRSNPLLSPAVQTSSKVMTHC